MGKLLLATALVLGSFGLKQTANAGVMLEPYVGYFLSGKIGDKDGKSNATGPGYGLRLAYYSMGFFAGAEYQGASLKVDSTPKSDAVATDIGATVGFNFPILLRVYGTYFVSSKNKFSAGGSSVTYEGSAIKLGVGWTAFPLVAFNVDFYAPTYTKYSASSGSGTLTDKVTGNLIMLNVSVPLTF